MKDRKACLTQSKLIETSERYMHNGQIRILCLRDAICGFATEKNEQIFITRNEKNSFIIPVNCYNRDLLLNSLQEHRQNPYL